MDDFQKEMPAATELLTAYADKNKRPEGLSFCAAVSLSAHTKCLHEAGVLSESEAAGFTRSIAKIAKEAENGASLPARDLYDGIFAAVSEVMGESGSKLKTALSRFDFYALTGRLFVKDAATQVVEACRVMIASLYSVSQEGLKSYFPGYADGVVAAPLNAGGYFLALAEMILRDAERMQEVYRAADKMPLWSGFGSGVNYELPREKAAELLGFSALTQNAYDTVSDVDYLLEFLQATALCFAHASKIAAEFVRLEKSGLIQLDESCFTREYPQVKAVPALSELQVQAEKANAALGSAMRLYTAAPMGGNRVLCNLLYEAEEQHAELMQALSVLSVVLQNLWLDGNKIRYFGGYERCTAQEVVDFLQKKGVSYADAVAATEKICAYAEVNGVTLERVPMEEYRAASDLFDDSVIEAVKVRNAIEEKQGIGSACHAAVRENQKAFNRRVQKVFRG